MVGENKWTDWQIDLIDSGKMIPDAWETPGDSEIKHVIKRAFYMIAIPQAWKLGDGAGPFVVI